MNDETYTQEGVEQIEEAAVAPAESAKAPLWRRLLFGAFVTLAVLFFCGVMLYEFGSMWLPDQAMKAQYEQMVVSGQAELIPARFHIPIPGCRCHSDDPVLTMQHSTRRISECGGCHG